MTDYPDELSAAQEELYWREELERMWPEPLPQDGDRLFVTDPDKQRTIQQQRWKPAQTYISGYIHAAKQVFEEAQRSAERARENNEEFWPPSNAEHWLVYPIYFLYRHAIELSLKDILRTQQEQGQLPDDKTKLLSRCHDVYLLWEMAKPWVMNFGQHKLKQATPAFETMLKEIQTNDPNAEAGRYHIVKQKGKPNQLVAAFEGIAPLDVNVIQNNALKMWNYIRWIWTLYEDYMQEEENRRWWEKKAQQAENEAAKARSNQ